MNDQNQFTKKYFDTIKDPAIAGARGLATDEPLDFDTIIKSLFLNPDRIRREAGGRHTCLTCLKNIFKLDQVGEKFDNNISHSDYNNPEFYINETQKLIPESKAEFNEFCIRLWNTKKLFEYPEGHEYDILKEDRVDKERYLSDIRNSKWYGPFKHSQWRMFYVYAFPPDLLSSYYVEIGINLFRENPMAQIANGITIKVLSAKRKVMDLPDF